MYIFGFFLETHVWVRIAGTENFEISTSCLTGKRSASELRSKIKLKYLQDSYLSMIATYISSPIIWAKWTLYSTDKFQLFEPSVGFKPTVRISILITSQVESFTVPRRRNAPKQFIFTPYLGLYRNLLSMASSFKRIQF